MADELDIAKALAQLKREGEYPSLFGSTPQPDVQPAGWFNRLRMEAPRLWGAPPEVGLVNPKVLGFGGQTAYVNLPRLANQSDLEDTATHELKHIEQNRRPGAGLWHSLIQNLTTPYGSEDRTAEGEAREAVRSRRRRLANAITHPEK